jgi:hypothetical protein
VTRDESYQSVAMRGLLAGVPVGIYLGVFWQAQFSLVLGLVIAVALAPSGAAAAAATMHAHRRFGIGTQTRLISFASGSAVAVAVIFAVVFVGHQLRLFDSAAPTRLQLLAAIATGMFSAYATLARLTKPSSE